MRIAFLGTGRMAQHLAKGWSQAGHEIVFGSRSPGEHQDLVDEIPVAQVVGVKGAASAGEVVVLAVPYTWAAATARQYADELRHKVVIDISNPFGNLPPGGRAGAQVTAEAIGAGARVVAAFKSNFWDTLLTPVDPHTGLIRDVLMAGDEPAAKAVVAGLIGDLGFRPVDCGVLENARVLDGLVPLIVELDRRYANGERRASWHLLF